MKQHKAIPER